VPVKASKEMNTLIINEQTSSILAERILTNLANIGMWLRYLRILKKVRMKVDELAYHVSKAALGQV
jgi:hypothetical protein